MKMTPNVWSYFLIKTTLQSFREKASEDQSQAVSLPRAPYVSPSALSPKVFLVHEAQAVPLPQTFGILCVSCPAGLLLTHMCVDAWELSSLCASVRVCVCKHV